MGVALLKLRFVGLRQRATPVRWHATTDAWANIVLSFLLTVGGCFFFFRKHRKPT